MSNDKDRKKRGGLGSRLRSMVFEEDTREHQTLTSAPTEDNSSTAPIFKTTRSSESSAAPRVTSVTQGVDSELVADIEGKLAARNSQAYTKFNDILSRLSALPNDETRFTAAVATAPALGLDPKSIRAAYDDRLKNLDVLQGQFEEQSKREYDTRVKGTEDEVKEIDNQIAELTNQIQELSKTRSAKAASVDENRNNITSVKGEMLAAFAAVKATVTNERDNVARHIQET